MTANSFWETGDKPTPDRGFDPKPHWGTSAPDPLGYSPQMKIPSTANERE